MEPPTVGLLYNGTLVHWYTGTLVQYTSTLQVYLCSVPVYQCSLLVHWRVCIDVRMYTPALTYTNSRYALHATSINELLGLIMH